MKTKTKILVSACILIIAALLLIVFLPRGTDRGPGSQEKPDPAAQETQETAQEDSSPSVTPPNTEMPKETRVGFYLDTVITLTAYTDRPELLEEGLEWCGKYEQMLSRTVEGSDVWRINHAEGKTVTVSPETAEILKTAIRISEASGGAFDITVAPASVLWDFSSGKQVVPDAEDLAAAAKKIDYRKIKMDGNDITLPQNMMIDLGGIAKGYIADAVKAKLEAAGIQNAILSFGGNIVTIGLKPDKSPWKVGIQDIDEPTGKSMLVSLNYGGSTVTSGIYERGFTIDGVTYHHILSAETGWPVQNELASVTIFSQSSMLGDALSTAVFALGTEKGAQLIDSMENVEALFITRDRRMSGTSGIGRYLTEEESGVTILPKTGNLPEKEGNTGKAVLQIQVLETDPAPGYILVQEDDLMGFLPLPAEGEQIREIIQERPDGSVWRNVIRMTPEGFCMTDADCEGHDCIQEGEVTLENMRDRILLNMVICAPHRLTLSLYKPTEAAAISRQWLGE